MKAKIKFNAEGIKNFFVNNGEKIIFAVTVIIFLLFLYSTITAKPLDDTKSPEAIKHESSQVVSTIQSPTWSAHRSEMGLVQTHYKELVDDSMRPISGQRLRESHEWAPPLFPELIKRADPEIFAVEELQIGAGSGLVAYQATAPAAGAGGPGVGPGVGPGAGPGVGPGGPAMGPGQPGMGPGVPGRQGFPGVTGHGEVPGFTGSGQSRLDQTAQIPGVHAPGADAEPKSYVVITGAVPVEKEVNEFSRRFESAVSAVPDPGAKGQPLYTAPPGQPDLPHYFCFLVDRSEVKDANDTARNWTTILSKGNYVNSDAVKDVGKWATQAPEIVHPDDVFDPVPFGTSLFYVTWPLPPLYLKNWGFEAAHPKVKLNVAQTAAPENQADAGQNGGIDAVTPQRGGMGGPMVAGHGVAPVRPGVGVGPGMGPGVGPGMGPGHGPGTFMGMQSQNDLPVDPYKLFRFVDLTAEAGKTYRYRVQLLVYNPNYALREDCLDPKAIQADTAKNKFAQSPWTETPAITVPPQVHVLADSITGHPGDLKARVSLLAYAKTESAVGGAANNPDTWLEVAAQPADVPLGGLIFVHDADIDKVLDMSADTVRKVDKINIDTNQTMLLDMRNDKPLGDGKSKEATELLLIDASGKVYDANHAADKLTLDDYMERSKPPAEMTAPGTETPVNPRPGGHGPGRMNGPGSGRGPGGPGAKNAKGEKG